jgi:hypothetical protein
VCALWGFFGAAAIEALDVRRAVQQTGKLPWTRRRSRGRQIPLAAYLWAVAVRVGVGTGAAAAAGVSFEMTAWMSVAAGITGPLVIERAAQQLPHSTPGQSSDPSGVGGEPQNRKAADAT